MRQRDLEILLERSVPAFPAPRPELEQYRTPARVAADWLYKAYALGDLDGRRVLDLGCGTGMLAVGAALLGAEVEAVDVDAGAVEAARAAAAKAGVEVDFAVRDVEGFAGEADTVLANPPFGAQKPGADRPFLAAALAAAPVAHVMMNGPSRPFVEGFAAERGAAPTHAWDYAFTIPGQFRFHARARHDVNVVVLRLVRNDHSKERSSRDRP